MFLPLIFAAATAIPASVNTAYANYLGCISAAKAGKTQKVAIDCLKALESYSALANESFDNIPSHRRVAIGYAIFGMQAEIILGRQEIEQGDYKDGDPLMQEAWEVSSIILLNGGDDPTPEQRLRLGQIRDDAYEFALARKRNHPEEPDVIVTPNPSATPEQS